MNLPTWEGLTAHPDDPGGDARTASMQEAVADLRRRQEAGADAADFTPHYADQLTRIIGYLTDAPG